MLALSTLKAASSSRAPVAARFNSTQAGNGPDASFGSATRSTVPPRSTHATYHPGGYGISQGLKRARKPYRVRNILTGSLIVAFATSVYFYSISKVGSAIPLLITMTRLLTLYQSSTLLLTSEQVKQDDFSDLAEIRAPTATDSVPVTTESDHKHQV